MAWKKSRLDTTLLLAFVSLQLLQITGLCKQAESTENNVIAFPGRKCGSVEILVNKKLPHSICNHVSAWHFSILNLVHISLPRIFYHYFNVLYVL